MPAAIPAAMLVPAPRPLPAGAVGLVATSVGPLAAILGAAGLAFSLFYGAIFTAMRAPRGLVLAFLAPGCAGALALLAWSISVQRGLSLLRRGVCVLGRVDSVAAAGATLGSPRLRVGYTFRPGDAPGSVGGATVVRGEPGHEPRPGDAIAVCFDAHRPSRSMALSGLG